jgi:hypothetical protein
VSKYRVLRIDGRFNPCQTKRLADDCGVVRQTSKPSFDGECT